MKKIFAILVTICLMASVLSVTAFAALLENFDEVPVGVVLRVSGLGKDGTAAPDSVRDYHNFADGWNAAIEEALTNNYDRIVVDFYADWFANKGEFCDDGKGFSYDAIYVPEDARVTLNLNGHTIDRAMTTWEYNGEVMCIDENADVIINEGTIKGGWSCNGAGGIHVEDEANLTLNNVHIVGNTADDDEGGGIALRNGASLVMNGGSFRDNRLIGSLSVSYGGAVYVDDSTATFNGVEFKNNLSDSNARYGVAISAISSTVTMKDCTFEGNGLETSSSFSVGALSVVHGVSSSIMAENCTFNNNRAGSMIRISGTYLAVNSSTFKNISDTEILIRTANASEIHVVDTTFSDNKAYAVSGTGTWNDFKSSSFFRNCTLKSTNGEEGTFTSIRTVLTFYDCTFSDCKAKDISITKYIKIEHSPVSREEAVMGVSELREDGTTVSVRYYKDFAAGWTFAMDSAVTGLYDRVAVDLYTDWNTKEYGAIIIPEKARVTLNLNGHTINRNRTFEDFDGEVICVEQNANVIINNGTVTGGYGYDGAGGIHIKDNARVALNNVNIVGNRASGSNGAGIAVYDGAILVMNGGSLSDNRMSEGQDIVLGELPLFPYGTLYVNDATATLSDVTINHNYTTSERSEGVAVCAEGSTVTLNNCVVSNNAKTEDGDYSISVISAYTSKLIISNTDFTGNGGISETDDPDYSHLFYLEDSSLDLTGGKITGNAADKIFYFEDSKADINGVTITDNESVALDVDNDSAKVTLTDCVLGNNSPVKYDVDIIVDTEGTLVLNDCKLGDTTFEDKQYVDFGNGTGVGSIFSGGSFAVIIAFVALLASAASFTVNAASGRKRGAKADN